MDVRIYYEDTDSGGVVYHANYLKYFERARTELFRKHNFYVAELAENGFVFPVVRAELDFKAPARHDELLTVTTVPVRISGSSFSLRQEIIRNNDGRLLVGGVITLACIGPNFKARRIPAEIRELLESQLESES
jgi:acyl-CoA thioester hydrolase